MGRGVRGLFIDGAFIDNVRSTEQAKELYINLI